MLNFPSLPSVSSVTRYIPAPVKNHWKVATGIALLALGALALAWKLKGNSAKPPKPRLEVPSIGTLTPNLLFSEKDLKVEFHVEKQNGDVMVLETYMFLHCCEIIIWELKFALKKDSTNKTITFSKDHPICHFINIGIPHRKTYWVTASNEESRCSWLYRILNAMREKGYIEGFAIGVNTDTIVSFPSRP